VKGKFAGVKANMRFTKGERMAASDGCMTQCKEMRRFKKDVMMKDAIDSAKVNMNSAMRKRWNVEAGQTHRIWKKVKSGNGFGKATLHFFE
jgi:hypothetical protein